MAKHDERMTSYLLGELSEAEQTELESQYFADATLVDRVIQVETRLLDEYARGRLSVELRARVERRYLAHPKRRARLKFADALASKLHELNAATPESRPERRNGATPWWQGARAWWYGPGRAAKFSMALAALVLIVIAGALLVERIRLRGEWDRTETARGTQEARERELQEQLADERASAQALATQLDRLRAEQSAPLSAPGPVRSTPTVVSLFLTMGGVRGPDNDLTRTLRIPPGTDRVRLQLSLRDTEYPRYQVVLQLVGGDVTVRRQNVRPERTRTGWLLVLAVPATSFAAGDYILTLGGVTRNGDLEDVGKSIFRVER